MESHNHNWVSPRVLVTDNDGRPLLLFPSELARALFGLRCEICNSSSVVALKEIVSTLSTSPIHDRQDER